MKIQFDLDKANPLQLIMNHNGKTVKLILSAVISRENKYKKEGMSSPYQFQPLEVYLAKKKIEDKVFEIYSDVDSRIMSSIVEGNPKEIRSIVDELLSLIDYEELKEFIVNTMDRQPLASLPDSYNDSANISGFSNRSQTYLKSEYIELCALITMFKLILPPLAHYQYLTAKGSKDKKALSAFEIMDDAPIMQLPPVHKVKAMIEKLKGTDSSNDIQHTLSNNISTQDIIDMVFASVSFSKLLTASILEDTDDRNIIKVLHGKIGNMTRSNAPAKVIIGTEVSGGGDEDSPSVLDNIRVGTDLSIGDEVEFEYVLVNPDMIILNHKHLGLEYNEDLWNEIRNSVAAVGAQRPSSIAMEMMMFVLQIRGNILDQRCFKHLTKEAVINGLTLTTIYFLNNNMLNAAMLASSLIREDFSNNNDSKATLTTELQNKLTEVTYGQMAKLAINNLAKEAMVFMYTQTLPARFRIGDEPTIPLPRTIRLDLAEILLHVYDKRRLRHVTNK